MTFNQYENNLFALALLVTSIVGSGLSLAAHNSPQNAPNPIAEGIAAIQAETAPNGFVRVEHSEVEITHIRPPTQAEITEARRVSEVFDSAVVEIVHNEVEINGVTIINGGDDFPVNGEINNG